jgi:dCTP deaminase
VLVLEAPDAIKKWRTLMGATDPAKADAGTLRKEFRAVDRAQRDARIRRGRHRGVRNRLFFRGRRPGVMWAGPFSWSAWSFAGVGLVIMLGVPLFRLPGDFYVKRGSFSFYFPLATLDSPEYHAHSSSWRFSGGDPCPSNPISGITRMARECNMIDPFVDDQVRAGVISYGVSSYGYDVRVGDEFKVFTNVYNTVVDPKNFDPRSFVDIKADVCIIPPNSFALARTIEYFRIPRDILTVCLGKSTYARCGIIVNVTPFEPEWEGHVTIEISNTTPLPAKIYANEGIAQVLFFQADEVCARSYKDKKGKYQAQRGVTLPRL